MLDCTATMGGKNGASGEADTMNIKRHVVRHVLVLLSLCVWGLSRATVATAAGGDPYLDGVRRFSPGESAGFGQDFLPWIVLGAPQGGGLLFGSGDVVSLGDGGSITVVFRDNLVFDGPGDDLVVFENAFCVNGDCESMFDELAFVEVSADGRNFYRFPVDPETKEGLAGRAPVLANGDNGLNPLAESSGGDRFDIGVLGLEFVRYLRLVDVDGEISDLGDRLGFGLKNGFDLDAAAAVNSSPPGRVSGSLSGHGQALAGVRIKLIPLFAERKRRRRSAADGSFAFRRVLPGGDYVIRARVRGRGKVERHVFLSLDQLEAHVDLAMN